jgi:molybdenum cofactor biosynthesis enzyme MoaA
VPPHPAKNVYSYSTGSSRHCYKARKRNKGKKENCLFANDAIIFIENPKKSTKNQTKLNKPKVAKLQETRSPHKNQLLFHRLIVSVCS